MIGNGANTEDTRFDALLRDLVTFGLVEPHTAGEHRAWRLSNHARRRLDSLVQQPPSADKLIYFGHHCSICRQSVATRHLDGAFVCDACRERYASNKSSGDGATTPAFSLLATSSTGDHVQSA